jgi:hypothetical protein
VRSGVRHVYQSAQTVDALEKQSRRCAGASVRCAAETVTVCAGGSGAQRAAPARAGAGRSEAPTPAYRCERRNSRGARPHTFTTRAAARRPQIRPRRRRRAHRAPARHQAANSAPCHGVRARRAGPGSPHTHRAPPTPRRRAPVSPVSPQRRSLNRQNTTTTREPQESQAPCRP